MRDDRNAGAARAALWIGLGVAALVAVVFALEDPSYHALFTLLNTQDDDGYLIATLRELNDGGALYTDVYSQYGPGIATFVGGLTDVFGVPLHTDSARLINLALWLGSTLVAGLALLRFTGNPGVAVAGALVAWLVLQVDANEPLHPGALIGFLLLTLALAVSFLGNRRSWAAPAAAGVLVGVLLSLKVNVGLFALGALVLTAVAFGGWRRHRPVWVAVVLATACFPFAALSSHLGTADTVWLGWIVSLGVLGLALVSRPPSAETILTQRVVLAFAAGLGGALLVAVGVPLIQGTSPADLVDGWVIEPSGTPDIQFVAAAIAGWAPLLSAAGLGAAVLWRWRLGAAYPAGRWWHAGIGAVRIAYGVIVWVALSNVSLGVGLSMTPIAIAAPFAWLVAVPAQPGFAPPPARFAIAALALLQPLHAFPLPGSQIGWAEILFVVVAGLCLADGCREAFDALARDRVAASLRAVALAVPAIAIGAWLWFGQVSGARATPDLNYGVGTPLELPGAVRLRLGADHAADLRSLAADLGRSCDTYISIPGTNSPYVWAGLEIPTVLQGAWPFFFDDERQREVVDQVRSLPDLCALENPAAMTIWESQMLTDAEGPLVDYISECFVPIGRHGGYVLSARRESCERSHALTRGPGRI